MKIFTLVAATALLSTPVLAADAIVYNEPAVADTFSWTGGYIGVNAGYAGGKFKSIIDFGDNANVNSSGFIGGVQAGYNWQMDQVVFGIETDIQGSGVKAEIEEAGVARGVKVNWFGTTRARLGYTATERLMVYATGGVAYGKVKVYDDSFGISHSKTKAGYTVGAGAEYAITNNVTFKSEYLYTDLGKMKFNGDIQGYPYSGEVKTPFHTVRVGVNYKF